jgi:hypothetical protein
MKLSSILFISTIVISIISIVISSINIHSFKKDDCFMPKSEGVRTIFHQNGDMEVENRLYVNATSGEVGFGYSDIPPPSQKLRVNNDKDWRNNGAVQIMLPPSQKLRVKSNNESKLLQVGYGDIKSFTNDEEYKDWQENEDVILIVSQGLDE